MPALQRQPHAKSIWKKAVKLECVCTTSVTQVSMDTMLSS